MNRLTMNRASKPDRKIDVKDPAPGIAVGDPSAQRGADDRGHHNADAVDRHGRAVLAGRKALQQDGLGQGLHAAAADALQHPGHDQHRHVDGHAA
jgi:hypothetical protein